MTVIEAFEREYVNSSGLYMIHERHVWAVTRHRIAHMVVPVPREMIVGAYSPEGFPQVLLLVIEAAIIGGFRREIFSYNADDPYENYSVRFVQKLERGTSVNQK